MSSSHQQSTLQDPLFEFFDTTISKIAISLRRWTNDNFQKINPEPTG